MIGRKASYLVFLAILLLLICTVSAATIITDTQINVNKLLVSEKTGVGTDTPRGKFEIFADPVSTYFTSSTTSNSGARGWHIDKPSTDSFPHSIAWDVDGITKWEIGMDLANKEFVLLFDHNINGPYQKSGDIFRVSPGARFIIGPGVGSPWIDATLDVHAYSSVTGINRSVALGTLIYGNNYNVLLRQLKKGSKLTKIGFSDLFQVGSDLNQNGGDNFWIWQNSANDVRFFINSDGNIGINTVNPRSTLHVAGEIYIKGVSEDGNGKVVCIKNDGNLGTCIDQPKSDGTCTCT